MTAWRKLVAFGRASISRVVTATAHPTRRLRRVVFAALVLAPLPAVAVTATTTTVSGGGAAASVTYGTTILLQGSVAGDMPSGDLTFSDGATTLGSARLENRAARSLAIGGYHSCMLDDTGSVRCWGANDKGQLGRGDYLTSLTPVGVIGLSTTIVEIAASTYATCALDSAGAVKCWGYNYWNQLGNGTSSLDSNTPVAVSGLPGRVMNIAAASDGNFTCALLVDHTVYCWGFNNVGQLGAGDKSTHTSAVQVTGLGGDVTQIAVGGGHVCALSSGGTVACWGYNFNGQLGQGNNTGQTSAVAVSLTGTVVSIATGGSHTCALIGGGAVYCWGDNTYGQVAPASVHNVAVTSPTQVPAASLPSDIVELTASGNNTCVRTTSASMSCWGQAAYSRLGSNNSGGDGGPYVFANSHDGSFTSPLTIVYSAIGRSCLINRSSGANVQCWGVNGSGQVGNGTFGASPVDWPTTIGSAATKTGAIAQWPLSTLAVGDHTITASYAGDAANAASNSAGYAQSVTKIATTLDLASDTNPSLAGQTVTLSATVTPSATTGTVTFHDATSGTDIGTADFASGVAQLTISTLAVGSHSITASFPGDATTAAATSSALGQTVAKADTTVTLDTTVSNPSVTLTATLSDSGATGTVAFKAGTKALGSATVSAGVATKTVTLTPGTYSLTATYAGDGTFNGSTSSAVEVVTTKTATTTALVANKTSVVFGQPVRFTATVGPSGAAGSVTFKRGTTVLGTVALASGKAALDVADLPVGAPSVTAAYGGSTTHAASLSSAVAVTVGKDASTTRLTANAAKLLPGASITLKATVATTAPGTADPTGKVVFKDGADVLGTVTLSGGVASLTTTLDTSGTHTLAAAYQSSAQVDVSSDTLALDVDGQVGQPVRVNAETADRQFQPALAVLKAGTRQIVWTSNAQDKSLGGIFGRRYRPTMAVDGGEIPINTTTKNDQSAPAVAALTSGGSVVVWQSDAQDGSGYGIYLQRFTAAGAETGPETQVAQTTKGDQTAPAVAPLANGRFVVVWRTPTGATLSDGTPAYAVVARTFSAAGAPEGAEFRVAATTTATQSEPQVASLGAAGFVVVWTSQSAGGSPDVRGQRFDAAGAKSGGVFVVDTSAGAANQSAVAATTTGFVVAWTSLDKATQNTSVRLQRFTATGAKLGGAIRANADTTRDHAAPSVAGFPQGGFVLAWVDAVSAAKSSIRVERFHGDGTPSDVEVVETLAGAAKLSQPVVATAGDTAFLLVYTADAPLGTASEVYVQSWALGAAMP